MKELSAHLRTKELGGRRVLSGYGSDAEQTEVIKAALPDLFEELAVESMDVPCGDFNWMRLLDPETRLYWSRRSACGDRRNQRLYGKLGRRFQVGYHERPPLEGRSYLMPRPAGSSVIS